MKILASVLFLLGYVATLVSSEECPDPAEIYPCSCREDDRSADIIVNCNGGIYNLLQFKFVLNSLSEKSNVKLDFYRLNLGTLPSSFFYGIGVKKLGIYDCELDSLTEEDNRPALTGLEDTLEELVIVRSFKERNTPTKLNLAHMRRLRKLDISFNKISELGNDWFDRGPISLEYLTVSSNVIGKLGDRIFANLIYLKGVSFDRNVCGNVLKRSIFPYPAYKLSSLQVDSSCLTNIAEDGFNGMPALKRVSLRANRIPKLEQQRWQRIWQQLDEIHLEGNPLECDGHMNWIFRLRTTSNIHGTCAAPPERRGLSLREFIESRS